MTCIGFRHFPGRENIITRVFRKNVAILRCNYFVKTCSLAIGLGLCFEMYAYLPVNGDIPIVWYNKKKTKCIFKILTFTSIFYVAFSIY